MSLQEPRCMVCGARLEKGAIFESDPRQSEVCSDNCFKLLMYDGLQDEIDCLKAESDRLTTIIEQDRTLVSRGLNIIKDAIRGHSWLRESRGSYSWDDDKWMTEFGMAIDDIEKGFPLLESVASNLNDSPIRSDSIIEARKPLAAVDRLKAENANLKDIWGDRLSEVAALKKENAALQAEAERLKGKRTDLTIQMLKKWRKLCSDLAHSRTQLAKYKEALEWYGHGGNYRYFDRGDLPILQDSGQWAREALNATNIGAKAPTDSMDGTSSR